MKSIFNYLLLPALFLFLLQVPALAGNKPKKELYQLTIYQYKTKAQEIVLDNYLKNALLPALHKYGYKNIGVFKWMGNDTAAIQKLYVYLPVKTVEAQMLLQDKLNNDASYKTAGAAYIDAVYNNAAYTRMEVILLKAFPLAPKMQLPQLTGPKNERIYELRSYESASEKIFANKVHMFNEGGEIELFKRLNFNAVFYAEVVAGSQMPNLMYLTTFENKTTRDEHWKNFVADPFWKKISSMPEYQNNVSHIDIMFLQPVEYSDF